MTGSAEVSPSPKR